MKYQIYLSAEVSKKVNELAEKSAIKPCSLIKHILEIGLSEPFTNAFNDIQKGQAEREEKKHAKNK